MSKKTNRLKGRLTCLEREVANLRAALAAKMSCALRAQQDCQQRLEYEHKEVLRLQRQVADHKGITDYIGGLDLRVVPQDAHAAMGFRTHLLTVAIRPEAYGHAFLFAGGNYRGDFRDVGHYVHLVADDVRRKVGKIVSETLSKMSGGLPL